MVSFSKQFEAASLVSPTKGALDAQARANTEAALLQWLAGPSQSLAAALKVLEPQVRAAYHASAALARAHMANQVDLPGWEPPEEKRTAPYLRALLDDVRRNTRDYLTGPRDDKALRRLRQRLQHSAGVASQRGYTDAMLRAAASLERIGVQVRKVWVANFVNNVPCSECRGLHGTEVGLDEQFESNTRVYRNLLGPPAHPYCRCILVLLVVGADNAEEVVDVPAPAVDAPTEMSTEHVKSMSAKIFDSLIGSLSRIVKFLRRQR